MELKKGLKNTLQSFEKNKENPFLKQAVEQVNNHVVTKYRTAGTTSQKAILRAVDNDNNTVGHTQFVKQIEVDEERFTKIYLSQFSAFFDLTSCDLLIFYKLNPISYKLHFDGTRKKHGWYRSRFRTHQGRGRSF